MYAYLRTVSGPDQGRIFDLTDGTTLVIGRGEKSDTHLNDASVARLHCELRCHGGDFRLVNLESVGGTTVGGLRIHEHRLKHGEEIQVGHTRLKLFTSAVADSPTFERHAQDISAAKASHADDPVLTGTAISHYELGPMLARGRTGTVYRAKNTRDEKDVAVKVLHADLYHDAAALRRFMRVMKAAVGLHHPNWVSLCGAGKHGETCWFAMEFVEGEPLTKVTERLGTRKMISWKYALSAGMQIARALEALHEKNIVHRDVAPENILIRSKDKAAKLGDPILAELQDGLEPTPPRAGELAGNVAYMAPERTRNEPEADIRADIYSLGATLYTMIAGRPPFEAKSLAELVAHIRQDDPVPLRRFQDSLPEEFQDVVEKMLSKRADMRYPTPAHALKAMERVARDQAALNDPGRSAFIRLQNIPGDDHGAARPYRHAR